MVKRQLPKKVIEQVKEFKKILEKGKLPMQGVYVFGSYAKGTARKDSDIDVAVISSKFKSRWDALGYLYDKLPYGLGWSIEPMGFNPKDFKDKYSTLIYEIKTHGVKV